MLSKSADIPKFSRQGRRGQILIASSNWTLDLTDVNRDPRFPNRHPHGYPEKPYRAEAGKTIRAEYGWLNRADGGKFG